MPRHRQPATPRRSPHLILSGAALTAAVLLGGTATASAIAPTGNSSDETVLLECKPLERAPAEPAAPTTAAPVKPSTKPDKPAPGKPSLNPAPGTTTPAETPAQPSTPPAEGAGTTAAERHGWGAPIAEASDDFNGAELDTSKWAVYDGPGHDGNGTRSPAQVTVEDGKLVLSGDAAGNSAGLASTFNQQYGRWEARIRSSQEDTGGTPYRPLLIVWSDNNPWPQDGEYDFFENPAPGVNEIQAFLHLPGHTPYRQEHAQLDGVDTSQWQVIGFEWTPDHLKGFVNGEEWFSFDKHDITGMPSGHLTIQLDADVPSGLNPATYEVDWVKTFSLD